MRLGPAPRQRTYHKAAGINDNGDVSALCFSTPRAIDMTKASWTTSDNAVTCAKCKRLMAARFSPPYFARPGYVPSGE